jgi:hypothetical protein
MEDLNIGFLPDSVTASFFSSESIVNLNSFAGHNFWLSDSNWMNRLFNNNIIQFNYPKEVPSDFNEHRGGWKSIKDDLINNDFYSLNNKFYFFDMLELQFLFDTSTVVNNKWSGIFHCTPNTPEYLNIINIENVFNNSNFIESLKNCVLIITLSNYLSKYFINKFNSLNLKIPVYTIKHPVEKNNILEFNYNNFLNNNNKKILQIGQQLRKVTSIYLLPNVNNYEKVWLTGTKNCDKIYKLFNNEIDYYNIDRNKININDVVLTYLNSYSEYDNLLSKNIVFIDLFDAAANNTVVECIIRNTPIIVNKIEGVVDYLGENYPLYFNHFEEIPYLITNEKIFNAYNYLLNMEKDELMIEFFRKKLATILYNHFSIL